MEIGFSTIVERIDMHEWKKLNRVITWLQQTINDVRIIGCDDFESLFTWVYAHYAVWDNMRSQTVGYMSMVWVMNHDKYV